ncbi:MAG: DNA recombination protein RmuC [Bacteroidales bacterium]
MTTVLYILLAIAVLVIVWLIISNNKSKALNSKLSADLTLATEREHEQIADLTENRVLVELLNNKIKETTEREVSKIAENNKLSTELSNLKVENGVLVERIRITEQEQKQLQEQAQSQFKLLANEIFDEKSKRFKESSESRLSEILTPLKENIDAFKKTINENYSTEAKERHSLNDRIRELIELNHSIGKEAKDLTMALKGNSKVQGDWGEMVLENILEKSGLVRDREFFVQSSTDLDGNVIRNEQGRVLRPDILIKFPDEKLLVVDSKVSLTAYLRYINSEDADEQQLSIKQHITSIRSHVTELRDKRYQDYVGRNTDFVMMFIPNEAAYISAMQFDHNLWQDAYDAGVLIISPTHLISVLKLIYQLWSHDKQTRNAINIAEESGKLYDKFASFVTDMGKIEKGLNSTQNSFNDAMKKLQTGTGNLMTRAEKIKALGAKASKSLPKAEE